MTYRLLLKAEAIDDITTAFEWYEKERTGLGAEFLNHLEDYFDRIISNPLQYQSHLGQRIAVVTRFPYKIVYEVEGDVVVVYAVFHDKRNPRAVSDR